MAPPPSDGSRGCVGTMRGVGHNVPCSGARQLAMYNMFMGVYILVQYVYDDYWTY
eukprot:COSAG01_NODE_337_length_18678_cov_21.905969_5_plen_55_part_00